MTVTLDDLAVDQPDTTRRDRWGRYLVLAPGGTKPVAYTRATTVAKALEDQHSLIAWKARVAAKGLTLRPELLKMIAVEENRQRIDDLVEQAAQAGGATERRDEGTALHRALELHFTGADVPALFRPDVDAVLAALAAAGLTVVPGMTERMCVLDEHQIAGTFDLVVTDDTTQFVADFKTGRTLEYSGLAFATQLAIYAHADALYTQGAAKNGTDDVRTPMPPVARDVALVVHVQPGSGVCTIHDVDIAYGRRALDLALEVRGARTKGRHLITPRASAGPAASPQRTETAPEPAPPSGSGAVRPATRREELAERLRALRAARPEAMAVVAAHWPVGVPAWNSGALYDRRDFEKIDAMLATYERAAEVPFAPIAQERIDDLKPEPFLCPQHELADEVGEPWPPVFDEGAPALDSAIDELLRQMSLLEGPGRQWALGVLREARDGGVPIHLSAKRSERAFAITRAVWHWASEHPDDDELVRCALVLVVGDDRVQPAFPTGAVIGALAIDEADRFMATIYRLAVGELAYVIDSQGARIEVVAS